MAPRNSIVIVFSLPSNVPNFCMSHSSIFFMSQVVGVIIDTMAFLSMVFCDTDGSLDLAFRCYHVSCCLPLASLPLFPPPPYLPPAPSGPTPFPVSSPAPSLIRPELCCMNKKVATAGR